MASLGVPDHIEQVPTPAPDSCAPEARSQDVVGAALVVGGGIGGMQAALDLAEAGIKVYLAEASPAIGGTMAQLDKTFPTNDCAMCIMSPKLVDVGRHLNIQVITDSSLESLEGQPGSFQATLVRRPRYVRLDRCTGCGECATACPIDRPDEFNWGLSSRKAIYKRYPQAIPNAYAIEKAGTSPCREACPIHQRAQGYVALIRQGRYADAYRTILEENPFPSICGRICNHRCEDACSRGQVDQPVNLMGLKRFVADWAWERRAAGEALVPPSTQAPESGQRVAIVGSGPAGLTCALDLRRRGHAVTVFEALSVPGGMMRVGIPSFRLGRDAIQREIDDILEQGIELRLNQRVEDLDHLMDEGYQAVFLGIGAHRGVRLPIPGAALPEVHIATDFLRQARLELEGEGAFGWKPRLAGRRVLVLGGGNVAIDAAMTARRFGAGWVGMACLEDRGQMPAHDWEVRDAEEEGIELFPARTFQEILSSGDHVTAVACSQIVFRGFVEGRPDFDVLPGTEEKIPADLVIFAIGQHPESGWLREAVALSHGRYLAVDPQTLATDRPGVFAGGDAVTGTRFVVDAIAAGHLAADSIDRYLRGLPLERPAASRQVAELEPAEAVRRAASAPAAARQEGARLPADQRRERRDEFVAVLSEEQAREEAGRCLDCGLCSECLQCAFVCKADAIDHSQREERDILQVGAVILAPGLEPIDASVRSEFGYGAYPNVVTSLEFERMLSASGPWGGVVTRPSDGAHPRRIAWIQCVGSRQTCSGQDYCSSICCMYATKEAVIAREHDEGVQPTIFYMDIRSHGKGFEEYIDRAGSEQGVRYVRSMVSAVKENPATGDLRLTYVTYGPQGRPEPHEETFDMVVLSVGLRPSAATRGLMERLGLATDGRGFPLGAAGTGRTSRPGVFVAGSLAEPKDIPETVVEAGCTAAMVSEILAPARGMLTRQVEFPAERDVREEIPRVGVFVCHCGINIGGVVDVPQVVEAARAMPDVVYAERNLYTCSQDTQERIASIIREQSLNRVVVASCTPRTHEPLFQDTLRQAGLNPSLFEMANIREQDAWVHRAHPARATAKAKELVAMAVAKARGLEPIQRGVVPVEPVALVIGGGLSGMAAARSIADQGYRVVLVERETRLGGQLLHRRPVVPGLDVQAFLSELVQAVQTHPRIECLLGTQVEEVGGYVGQFRTRLRAVDGSSLEVEHGVTVVSSGGQAVETDEFGSGSLEGVLTQQGFENWLAEGDVSSRAADLREGVVMIQCVGSRQPGRAYCSRVCCTEALQNALQVKALDPSIPVTLLYRDLRSYGFREALYRQARAQGVRFLQYTLDDPPQVAARPAGLSVRLRVQPEAMPVELGASKVVLSTGIGPNPDNAGLSQLLKVPLTRDGFFLEAHAKLRPVDFAAEGVFVCGLAHSPRTVEECLEQAKAVAVRAVGLLSKPSLSSTPIVASVNPRLCSACGVCVDICPFGARQLDLEHGVAQVIEVLCQGCGACVAACPNKASQQRGFTFRQVAQMVEVAVP